MSEVEDKDNTARRPWAEPRGTLGNRNYRKGANKEYREKNKLEADGWLVVRSAGSHSPIDLIAIRKYDEGVKDSLWGTIGKIRFIQCKVGKHAEREREKALKEIEHLRGIWMVEVEAR